MKPQVLVAIPVLNRPDNADKVWRSINSATPEPHQVAFIADESDKDEIAALKRQALPYFTMPDQTPWGAKINEAIQRTEAEWILAAADDLSFHAGWFSRALRWADDNTGVIGTNDICNPRVMRGIHSTHPLIRRSYAMDLGGTVDGGPGKAFHEGYRHEYADDELVQTAMARGAYVHAFDSIVEHLHPMVGKADEDPTYVLGRQHTQLSKQLFRRRSKLWRNLSA